MVSLLCWFSASASWNPTTPTPSTAATTSPPQRLGRTPTVVAAIPPWVRSSFSVSAPCPGWGRCGTGPERCTGVRRSCGGVARRGGCLRTVREDGGAPVRVAARAWARWCCARCHAVAASTASTRAIRRVRTAGAPGLLVLRLGPRGLSVRWADHPAALLLHCRTVHPWRLMRRHARAGCGARGQHRSGGGLETVGGHRASPLALRMPCLRYPRTMASWPLRGRR